MKTKTFYRRILLQALAAIPLLASVASEANQPSSNKHSFHKSPAPQPKAGSLFMYPERVKLSSGGFVTADRGLLFVPLNRSDKNSDVIAVEIYRFKADKTANPGTPPIFYLPGGPGYDGLEGILERHSTYYETRIKPKLAHADMVIVSQRGIGPAKPTTTIEITLPAQPLDKPYDWQLQTARYQKVLSEEREVWQQHGVDLKGYNISEAAADINDIRIALGYDKITLWGGSFGSHWAMATMRQHPEVIARAVLWGMEGPDHTYDHPAHIWEVYRRVAIEAGNDPQLARHIPKGGLIKAVESIVQRVDEKPFTITIEDGPLNKDVLFDSDTIRSLTQGYSAAGLSAWPADIITMYNGDFTAAANYLIDNQNTRERRFRTASYYMLDCSSGITKKRLSEYHSSPAANYVSNRNWTYEQGCPVWQGDLGDKFRQNFHSNIPTLIIQGTWDLYTPYENAEELAPYFKNSAFVTVKRGPHWAVGSAMQHSAGFSEDVYEFLSTGDLSQFADEIELPLQQWQMPKKMKLAVKK